MAATKAELEEAATAAFAILDSVYEPESSREDLAVAVGQALDVLNGALDDDDAEASDDAGEEEYEEES